MKMLVFRDLGPQSNQPLKFLYFYFFCIINLSVIKLALRMRFALPWHQRRRTKGVRQVGRESLLLPLYPPVRAPPGRALAGLGPTSAAGFAGRDQPAGCWLRTDVTASPALRGKPWHARWAGHCGPPSVLFHKLSSSHSAFTGRSRLPVVKNEPAAARGLVASWV